MKMREAIFAALILVNILWGCECATECGSFGRFVAASSDECPCTSPTNSQIINNCNLPHCSNRTTDYGELCEADQTLPDGNTNYEVDNCSTLDVFKCVKANYARQDWNGLCFDGQNDGTNGIVRTLSHEECKNKCTWDSSCIAFASHSENAVRNCWLALEPASVSEWTAGTHQKFTCYAKLEEPTCSDSCTNGNSCTATDTCTCGGGEACTGIYACSYGQCLEQYYARQDWNGLCFDDQRNETYGSMHLSLSNEECKNSCTTDSSCIAFAVHPTKNEENCWLTLKPVSEYLYPQVSEWTKTTHQQWQCYAKSDGFTKVCDECKCISWNNSNRTLSFDDCKIRCLNNYACTGITYWSGLHTTADNPSHACWDCTSTLSATSGTQSWTSQSGTSFPPSVYRRDCHVEGAAGDGISQGDCAENSVCNANGRCTENNTYVHFTEACVHMSKIGGKNENKTIAECKYLCSEQSRCLAFTYGVDHGGSNQKTYKPKDCQLRSSDDQSNCDGTYYNLDLYVKQAVNS